MQLMHTLKTIFDPSLQAILIADGTDVIYANQSAIDLLGFSPIDMPLIRFVSFRLATDCFTPIDEAKDIKRVLRKINGYYYDVVPLRMQNYLLLFLYYPDVVHTTKALLQDSAYTLRALTATATAALQNNDIKGANDMLYQLDLAIEEMISTANAALSPYDFTLLFQHAMQSFSCVSDKGFFSVLCDPDQPALLIPMQNQLLHAALVGTVFDLLRLIIPHDHLTVTCTHQNNEAVLTFSCAHTHFPDALASLLLAQEVSNPVAIIQEHGSHLFRAKRIFSLHGGNLTLNTKGDGFSLAVAFPCAANTSTLYTRDQVLLDVPMHLSLPAGYIRKYFLSDLEEA